MALHSGASYLKLMDILLELHRTRRSCIIRFERDSVKRQLALYQGAIIYAESNLKEEHLAQVLVSLDYLPRKELKNVSAHMKGGKSSDEAVVLATGLDGGSLEKGVREQALLILASLLAWSGYETRLFEGEGLFHRRFQIMFPLPQALVEAARRAVKGRILPAGFLPAQGVVSAIAATGERAGLPLSREEAFAYGQVTAALPLARLLPSLPPGETRPEDIVKCLLLLGLIGMETAPADAADAIEGLPGSQLYEQVEERLQQFEVASLYEILALPATAGVEEVKVAYHDLAKLYHPDRFASKSHSPEFRSRVEKLFTYITGAYTTLIDPVARAQYDETRLQKESQVEATLQGRSALDQDKEKMAETMFRAGRAALINKEFDRAAQHLRECVWLSPETARFHHFLGLAQSEIPLLRKEAEQHLLKAIALEQMNPESYLGLGRLYLKVNLPKRAEAQFNEALRWDPENPEALRMLEALARESRK